MNLNAFWEVLLGGFVGITLGYGMALSQLVFGHTLGMVVFCINNNSCQYISI
jgi:hypothetical protein